MRDAKDEHRAATVFLHRLQGADLSVTPTEQTGALFVAALEHRQSSAARPVSTK